MIFGLKNGAPVVAPYKFQRFGLQKLIMIFAGFFVPTWPPKSMEIISSRAKLGEVGLKLAQLGLNLGQVGVSNASLDVQVHKMWFPCAVGALHGPT